MMQMRLRMRLPNFRRVPYIMVPRRLRRMPSPTANAHSYSLPHHHGNRAPFVPLILPAAGISQPYLLASQPSGSPQATPYRSTTMKYQAREPVINLPIRERQLRSLLAGIAERPRNPSVQIGKPPNVNGHRGATITTSVTKAPPAKLALPHSMVSNSLPTRQPSSVKTATASSNRSIPAVASTLATRPIPKLQRSQTIGTMKPASQVMHRSPSLASKAFATKNKAPPVPMAAVRQASSAPSPALKPLKRSVTEPNMSLPPSLKAALPPAGPRQPTQPPIRTRTDTISHQWRPSEGDEVVYCGRSAYVWSLPAALTSSNKLTIRMVDTGEMIKAGLAEVKEPATRRAVDPAGRQAVVIDDCL